MKQEAFQQWVRRSPLGMGKVKQGSRWHQGFEQPPSLEALKSRVEEALSNMVWPGG